MSRKFSLLFFPVLFLTISAAPLAEQGLPQWIWWLIGIVCLVGVGLLATRYFLRRQVKLSTRNLERSRAELELIMDSIPEMISYLDTDLRYIYVAESYANWYGYSREEVIGKYVRDILPPENYVKVHPNLLKVVQTGEEMHYQHRATRYDGTETDVAISYIPKKDAAGKVEAFFATVRDITEEKKNESALEESEAKYRQLVDNSRVGIFILQEDKIVFLNNAILNFFGYERAADMLKLAPFALVAPSDEDLVREEILQKALPGDARNQFTFRALRRDGSIFYAQVFSQRVQYKGEPALQGILLDVSERIKAEQRFNRFSEASYEAIFISEKGVLLEQNQAAERMFGYTEAEAVGQAATSWIAFEDRDRVLHHMLSGYEEPYRVTALRKDGSTFPAEIIGRMMDYDGRRMRVTALRDIRNQVSAEEELRLSEERYRSIVQNSHAVMLLIDLETCMIIEANQAASDFYGWSLDELRQMSLFEINILSKEESLKKAQGEKRHLFICKHRLASGEVRDVEVYNGLVPYQDRQVLFSVIHDITARVEAKRKLLQSKEQLQKIIAKAPIPMAVIEHENEPDTYNERFSQVFQYTAEDLKDWWKTLFSDEKYRAIAQKAWEEAIAQVKTSGETFETQTWEIARKDGAKRIVEFDMVPLDDFSVVVMNDITEKKLTRKIISVRAALAEYSLHHSLDELLRKTIDEVEELTQSEIGFYHLISENQQGITLQQWSTRTAGSYCKVPNLEMHYPVSEAGVWADCIETQTPLIHNDYATLENRQGLPEGHAPLLRELVVPVLRAGKVVAILGVGNKPTAYTQQDVEVVSQIADLSLEIAEQKKAEQALRESQSFLLAAQRIAKLGSYRFLINENHWTNNIVLDDIFGLTEEYDRSLMGWLRLIHPTDRKMMQEYFSEEVVKKGQPFDKVYRVVHQITGETRWVHGLGELSYDAEGNLLSMFGTIQDITERKLAERSLEKSERRLRNLVNTSPDIICFKDGMGRWQMANEAVLALLGLAGVQYQGKTDAELAQHSSLHHDILTSLGDRDETAWQSGQLVRENETFPLPDGGYKIYDMIKVPSLSKNGKRESLLILGRDVTELVGAQEELAQYAQQLEVVNAISSTLSTSLSVDELIDTILNQVSQVIPAESVAVFLVEDEENVCLVNALGRARIFLKRTVPLSQTLMRKIDLSQRVLMINDVLADPDFLLWDSDDRKNSIFRSWMGIALIAHGERIGYLSFDHARPNAYTDKDVQLAKSFTTQIAQALANAQLYERVIANANDLEKHIQERTQELQDFVDMTAGREIRMVELKDMIHKLRSQIIEAGDVPVTGEELDLA